MNNARLSSLPSFTAWDKFTLRVGGFFRICWLPLLAVGYCALHVLFLATLQQGVSSEAATATATAIAHSQDAPAS